MAMVLLVPERSYTVPKTKFTLQWKGKERKKKANKEKESDNILVMHH